MYDRISNELEEKIAYFNKVNCGQIVNENQWSEFIADIWTAEDKLHHFGINCSISHIPETQQPYGLSDSIANNDVTFEDESNIVIQPGLVKSIASTNEGTIIIK